MATGIPKPRRKRALPRDGAAALPESAAYGLQVVYEGKSTERDVLATPPAEITEFRRGTCPQPEPNRMYFGDNLPLLAALLRDPAVCGHVTLIYIDPPYATSSTFESRDQEAAYDDLLTGPHYVEFLRKRLEGVPRHERRHRGAGYVARYARRTQPEHQDHRLSHGEESRCDAAHHSGIVSPRRLGPGCLQWLRHDPCRDLAAWQTLDRHG